MKFIEIIGLIAGGCTSAALLPQLIKTIKTKKAADVSVFMFIVMLTGNVLWVYYGFVKSELPIIITNFISIAFDISVIFFKYKYKENK